MGSSFVQVINKQHWKDYSMNQQGSANTCGQLAAALVTVGAGTPLSLLHPLLSSLPEWLVNIRNSVFLLQAATRRASGGGRGALGGGRAGDERGGKQDVKTFKISRDK